MRRTRRRGIGHEAEGGQAVIVILLVVLVMGVGGWVAAYAGADGKIPRGTTIAGVDVGGRSRSAAAAALAHGLRIQGEEPITLSVGSLTTQVAPADAGLSVDYVASVARALGPRSWDPRRLWNYYTGGDVIAPVVHVDYRRMDALLAQLDQKAGQPPRDAGISLRGGQIALTKPQNGVAIDQDHARETLIDAYAAGSRSVQLPLLLSQPDVDQADLDTALTTIANPAMRGPVTLAFDGSHVTLEPRQYADLLSLVDKDGSLALDVDSAGLAAMVNPSAHDTKPVDATVALENGGPTVVPAIKGKSYDEPTVTAAFLKAVTADGAARTVPVDPAGKVNAEFSTKDAKHLGVTQPVASYTVSVPSSVGPSFADAVNRLSGALLRPGDTFSFNARVGAVSGSGTRLATAAWNAGFLAGLTDVARSGSPTYTDGLPEGRDAMVDAATDLQMRNDTSYGVMLSARLQPGGSGSPGTVVVDAWSTKQYDISATAGAPYAPIPRTTVASGDPGCVASAGADGFSVDLVRTWMQPGDPTPVRSETVTTTYQPQEAVVCQPALAR